jgi:hypothetical protein
VVKAHRLAMGGVGDERVNGPAASAGEARGGGGHHLGANSVSANLWAKAEDGSEGRRASRVTGTSYWPGAGPIWALDDLNRRVLDLKTDATTTFDL